MKKPIRVNERGIRIGESHPNARLKDSEVEELLADRQHGLSLSMLASKYGLSKSGVKAICDGRSRGQIGQTVDKVQTVPAKQQYVRVKLSVPLAVRAKLHRLGGASWLIKRVTEGRERHVLPEIGFVTESAVLEHYPVTRDKWRRLVAAGIAPSPVKIGGRAFAYDAQAVRKFLKAVSGEFGF